VKVHKYSEKNKIDFLKSTIFFISHLHGDHFFGLIGLVSTFTLLNRNTDLHIYGPKGIKEIIKLQLRLANSWTIMVYIHELESNESEIVLKMIKCRKNNTAETPYLYQWFLFEKIDKRKLNTDAVQIMKLTNVIFKI
jgi:ribonuclease Z